MKDKVLTGDGREAGGRGCSHLAYGRAKKRWYGEHGLEGRREARQVFRGEAGRRLRTSTTGDIVSKITPM